MALINGKWHVVRGDCLWNIAKSVYGSGYKWTIIADANGVSRSNPIIYPGQVFTIPGISSTQSPAPSTPVTTTPEINWFALDAGTTRSMFATWTFDRANTDHYEVNWDYNTGAGGWRIGSHGTTSDKQSSYTAPDDAKQVRLSVKPISQTYTSNNNTYYYWTNGGTVTKEYDFSNNPPELPPTPTFEISTKNVLTATFENIQETINAENIEIAVYQDNEFKYKTGIAKINTETRYAKYTCDVEAGHYYKIRCRGVRGSIYGGWTDYTDNDVSTPVAPTAITTLRSQKISEQGATQYAVFVEWDEVSSAKTYVVEYTPNVELFDTGDVSKETTEEGKGPRLLISGIELGHEYYFRVGSINDKGQSIDYTPIQSVKLGTKPAAPTTYSNVNSCVIGEDLKLYWVHNSTDGSIESSARIHFLISDSAHPELAPTEIYKVIPNNKPEEEKTTTSVYTINTSDPDWATLGEGYIIKWKIQTAGVIAEYSDWSIERETNVYSKPELDIDIKNSSDVSIEEINSFPFYISVLAKPAAQIPISYYVEIVSNNTYQTVDSIGNVKMVSNGDKIYQKYYDPQDNPWRFLLEMTPGNIDLENNMSYTVKVTVSMNSGLTAISEKTFKAYLDDVFYDVFGDVIINDETLEANIHPYCNEYNEVDGNIIPSLVKNCTMSVYRREYDGTFTEIASNIPNEADLYVTDPHPSLDYARYRVVARTNDTGAISYADIPVVKVGNPAVVIQWSEKWTQFIADAEGEGAVEPAWSGSMLRIPYNIKISDNKSVDVSLVKYAGRKRPVSYYGTQLGETATWNVDIPKDDKELLYAIRRLSIWTGDVYVREPSGIGYWANISVSYNIDYSSLVVPVTFNITRVEGGI